MKKITVSLVLATISTIAGAAETGAYVYASVGQADSSRKAQADASITGLGATAFTSSANESDTTYALQAGWSFNPYLSVEGGYVNLGDYSYSANVTAPTAATRNAAIKVDGWNVGVVGALPLGEQFSIFAKAGVFNYKLKFHADGTGIAVVNPDRTDDGSAIYYGLGANWNFSSNWFARAEYQVFQDIGTELNVSGTTGTSKADIKVGSVGVGYRF